MFSRRPIRTARLNKPNSRRQCPRPISYRTKTSGVYLRAFFDLIYDGFVKGLVPRV
jgi:hypothetical protein